MIKKFYVLVLISLIFLSTFVLAAGSSTANAQNTNSCETDSDCTIKTYETCCQKYVRCMNVNERVPRKPDCNLPSGSSCGIAPFPDQTSCQCINSVCTGTSASNLLPSGYATTCEDKATLRERIKCRFDNPQVAVAEARNYAEEACRSSERKEACENLYKASAKCYDEANPVAKKRCFLQESGISINSGGTFRAAPTEAKRNYVVLLLYELQERIEEMQEEGKITTDQATSLVTKIVEIKKMILAGEKRADIIVKMQEFKKEYRTVMAGVEK